MNSNNLAQTPEQAASKAKPCTGLIEELFLVSLIIATSAVTFFVKPYRASNLDLVPDSVEYAIGAHHIAHEGSYYFMLDGKRLPPRYPPWFSAFILAPAYLIFGSELGNAILPVTFLAIAGILVAFLIGRRISGTWGGLIAAAILFSLEIYRQHARVIMSDVPSTALILFTGLLYLRFRQNGNSANLPLHAFAGIAGALCGAARPVSICALIPFGIACILSKNKERLITRLFLLSAPAALLIAATLAYNQLSLGSPLRDGYHFWCPVPFDYPALAFSPDYALSNLKTIMLSFIPAMLAAIVVLALLDLKITQDKNSRLIARPALIHLMEYSGAIAVPTLALHVAYFYPAERFYLPIMALLAVITGSMAGKWLQILPRLAAPVFMMVVTLLACMTRLQAQPQTPLARILARQLDRITPANAIIIPASIDPVYLNFFVVKSTQRRIIPLSRNLEYASKVVCRKKVINPTPPPTSWWDHRCKGLLNGGAEEAVARTADESMTMLHEEAAKGTPIFLEACRLFKGDIPIIESIQANFDITACGNDLYQLTLKKTL